MKTKEENISVKSDLQLVCEMQRKIDIYECYFNDLFLLVSNKGDVRDGKVSVLSLIRGTEIDDTFSYIFSSVTDLIKNPPLGIGNVQEMTKQRDNGSKTD